MEVEYDSALYGVQFPRRNSGGCRHYTAGLRHRGHRAEWHICKGTVLQLQYNSPHARYCDVNDVRLQLPDSLMLFITGVVLYGPSYLLLQVMPRPGDKKLNED